MPTLTQPSRRCWTTFRVLSRVSTVWPEFQLPCDLFREKLQGRNPRSSYPPVRRWFPGAWRHRCSIARDLVVTGQPGTVGRGDRITTSTIRAQRPAHPQLRRSGSGILLQARTQRGRAAFVTARPIRDNGMPLRRPWCVHGGAGRNGEKSPLPCFGAFGVEWQIFDSWRCLALERTVCYVPGVCAERSIRNRSNSRSPCGLQSSRRMYITPTPEHSCAGLRNRVEISLHWICPRAVYHLL